MSLCRQTDITLQTGSKSVIHQVQALLEFPAETLSLQRRVEQFSRCEGRTTGPHHHGYSNNMQFGRPTERAAPPHSYG
ncbi:hypothetical protein AMECASPLE_029471, partial [Ameca splendens]